ncbi:MAG TPA: hypothetical protein VFD32_01150, partial [Dehalococcoidia bacterium]|nr:hypothetical protein [Dehalococcoidia bacterium]
KTAARWLLLAALLLPLSGLLRPRPAHASEDWCFDDPVLVIGARSLRINLGVQGTPAQVAASVSSAEITVYVPQGVLASLSLGDSVHFPEHVRIVPVPGGSLLGGVLGGLIGQPIPVTIAVSWQANAALPTQISVTNLLTLRLTQLLSTSVTHGTTTGELTASFSIY